MVFSFVPAWDEWAEMSSGRKDEAIDIVLLKILYFLLLPEEISWELTLPNADDIGLTK